MTTLNNRPAQQLTGAELLQKVKELGDISKTGLCLARGYTRGNDEEGNPRPHFTAFYEALLEAKGVELQLPKEEEKEEPVLSGLSLQGFTDEVFEHVQEARKLLPNDRPVLDKVCALTQLAALLKHHQDAVQSLELEGKNPEAWINDVERLNESIRLLLSVDLGTNDYWYRVDETAPKAERKGETNVGLKVFTDVVRKANALQAEVDQLKKQLGERQAKKSGLLNWLFPATF